VHDALLIARREFLERVHSKSFLVGTLVFPVLMMALIALPRFVGSRGTEWNLVILNEGPAGMGEALARELTARPADPDDNTYRVAAVRSPQETSRQELSRRVLSEEIDGYLVLPPDVLEQGRVLFRARNAGSFSVMRDLSRAATRAVQATRLRRAGTSPQAVAALIAPATIDEARITTRGEQKGGAMATFLAAYVVAFLIYLMTTLYGVAVMRSVLEEKTNRIAEVLMSTIRASHLMGGKIAGVGSAAVAQVAIWSLIGVAAASQSERLGIGAALPESVRQALRVEPATAALFFLFFLLGFFLYASIFAAVGAAVTSEQEAQSVQFIALIPLILPLMFLDSILNAPLGATAVTLGLIPLAAPIAMPMRMATSAIPGAQIAASLALLLVGIVVVAWIAGKIYRIGILSTGKRPTLAELIRWIRMA
jgi:ABC-2 type transport system permease protein